ncbi:MAG: BON domain-containing protein [Bacteroidota bacterium]
MITLIHKTRRWLPQLRESLRRKDAQTKRDRQLTLKIANALEMALKPNEAESLSFYVREGSVTVFGTTCQPANRAFVLELVRRVPGVREVNDYIRTVAYEEVF